MLSLIPALAVIGILAGLYGIYIMYLGFGPVLKTPADKTIPYMVVSFIVVIVLWAVIMVVAGLVAPIGSRVAL